MAVVTRRVLRRHLCNLLTLIAAFAFNMAATPSGYAQGTTADARAVRIAAIPEYRHIVERVSVDSIIATLRMFESLGVKEAGTAALAETADWLEARYRSFGYATVVRQDLRFRNHTLQNLVVTKAGTTRPATFLFVTSHYDTAEGPGVNDNGSGVAVLLEVARVLAGIDTDLSIRFVNFSGEEVGLVGSQAYVEQIVMPEAMDIALVLNVDEVGGMAGTSNTVITCERDEGPPIENNAASAAHTDTLAALTREYTSLETRIAHAFGSDYLPFENAGYVITGFYEANRSRYPHTSDDVLANLDPEYVTEVARATAAAVLHFARGQKANPTP